MAYLIIVSATVLPDFIRIFYNCGIVGSQARLPPYLYWDFTWDQLASRKGSCLLHSQPLTWCCHRSFSFWWNAYLNA